MMIKEGSAWVYEVGLLLLAQRCYLALAYFANGAYALVEDDGRGRNYCLHRAYSERLVYETRASQLGGDIPWYGGNELVG